MNINNFSDPHLFLNIIHQNKKCFLEIDSNIQNSEDVDDRMELLFDKCVEVVKSNHVTSLAILKLNTSINLDARFLSIINLIKKELVITGANQLENIDFLKNTFIEELVITGAHHLKELPYMPHLNKLVLTGAHKLKTLPSLPRLEEVTITGAENFDIDSVIDLVEKCSWIKITGLPGNQPDRISKLDIRSNL